MLCQEMQIRHCMMDWYIYTLRVDIRDQKLFLWVCTIILRAKR